MGSIKIIVCKVVIAHNLKKTPCCWLKQVLEVRSQVLPYLALSDLSLGSSILAQSNVKRTGQCSWRHTTLNQSCLWVISREIRASTRLQLKSKLLLTKNRVLECCVGRRLHIKSHSWRQPYSLLPQHLTVSPICLLHTLTVASPQLCKEVEYVGAFSSHSPLLTFQVMLYMQCQGYITQTAPVWWHKQKQKSHAMPFLGDAFYKLCYLQALWKAHKN